MKFPLLTTSVHIFIMLLLFSLRLAV